MDLGYRYLETDVHATRDGQVLAFHDHVLDRVTDARGAIAELPYAAVRAARVGGTEAIPLLADLLEELPDVRINIDVKAAGRSSRWRRCSARHDAIDRVCIGSFSRSRLRAVRALLGPAVATAAGPVGGGRAALRAAARRRLAALPRPRSCRSRRATWSAAGGSTWSRRALVERVHPMGKHVHVWTIDDADGDAPAARPRRGRDRVRPHRHAGRRPRRARRTVGASEPRSLAPPAGERPARPVRARDGVFDPGIRARCRWRSSH